MAMLGYKGSSAAPRMTQEGTDPSQMFGAGMGGHIMREVIPAGLGVLAGLAFGGSAFGMAAGGAIGGGIGRGIVASGSEPGTAPVYQQGMQGSPQQPTQDAPMALPQAPAPGQQSQMQRLSSLVGGAGQQQQQQQPNPEEDPSGYANALLRGWGSIA